MNTAQVIILMIISVWLGVGIGQLLAHRDFKPIINGYKSAIEDYKKIIQQEREIREEMIVEYNKLIDILKNKI
jgi:hypothetical protein